MKKVFSAVLLLALATNALAAPPAKYRAHNKAHKKYVAPKIRTTATGLKIQDLRIGKGRTAKAGDTVSVNYRGTLRNGKMFDQSYGRAPFSFQLGAGQVIKGWDQGVAGMKVGGKRKLIIPPGLGYGATGAGGVIPPNATLIFQVELLKAG